MSDSIHFAMPPAYPIPVRVLDIAKRLYAKSHRFPVAARFHGKAVGLQTILPKSGDLDLQFLFSDSPEALSILRHSTAHLLARAVMRLYPDVQLAFGPATDNGFYCDFHSSVTITEEDLPAIEQEMKSLIRQGGTFECIETTYEEAQRLLTALNQPMKLEHLTTRLRGFPKIFFYRQGEFLDMSRGPHVANAEMLQHFKLLSITAANWKGDPANRPLQRINGTAFFHQTDLEKYLTQLEEAQKRDHRILGKQLELYAIDPRIGSGFVLWLPKGAAVRYQLETFLAEKLTSEGFQRVYSPEMGRTGLYSKTSKNLYSAESSFPLVGHDSYALRPTCGMHHVAIYQNHPRSYRELPLRFFEFGNVCRYEPAEENSRQSGLKGLQACTRNDTHIFCTQEELPAEFARCLRLMKSLLSTFGFQNLRIQTLFRGEDDIEYSGTLDSWQKYESVILNECSKLGLPTFPGGTVHPEGPGIDFIAEDSLGRAGRFGTVHIDFKLPGKKGFDLSYVGQTYLHRPMMLHCTPLDSFERFIGILIEHFAGAFPFWLAPEQVRILIVSPKYEEYARQVEQKLKENGLRAFGDYRSEKIGAKIRRAQLQLVPYMVIIGQREAESRTVAVRDRISGNLGNLTLDEAIWQFTKERMEKKLKHAPGTL